MNKLFFIFFISLYISKFNLISQTVLVNKEITKLTVENFPESIYYKVLKTEPEIQIHFISAKTIDSGCINYQTKEFDFKKEKISFVFTNNYDTTKINYLESILIKGKNSPFITQDSIKVGDKILLSAICNDIDKLKAQYIRRNDKNVDHIFCNNITYYIDKIPVVKIDSETVVRISKIYIVTYGIKD